MTSRSRRKHRTTAPSTRATATRGTSRRWSLSLAVSAALTASLAAIVQVAAAAPPEPAPRSLTRSETAFSQGSATAKWGATTRSRIGSVPSRKSQQTHSERPQLRPVSSSTKNNPIALVDHQGPIESSTPSVLKLPMSDPFQDPFGDTFARSGRARHGNRAGAGTGVP